MSGLVGTMIQTSYLVALDFFAGFESSSGAERLPATLELFRDPSLGAAFSFLGLLAALGAAFLGVLAFGLLSSFLSSLSMVD